MVTPDAIVAVVSAIVLGLLGYLLARNQSQVDKHISALWRRAEECREQRHALANNINNRLSLIEGRLERKAERIKALEDKVKQ